MGPATIRATGVDNALVNFLGPVNIGTYGLTVRSGGNGTDFTLSGPITGSGPVTRTSSSASIMTLLAANHTGPTENQAGVLVVGTGSTGGGDFILANNNTMLGALVTAPGTTLNLANLTLGPAGGTAVGLQFDLGAFGNPTADVMNVVGTITEQVTNCNITVLAEANTLTTTTTPITLLDYPAGQFTTAALGTVILPADLVAKNAYVTNNPTTSAIELVIPGGVTLDPPPSLTNNFAGNQVQLSWGAEYQGYTLQVQTNTLSVGLSMNWQNIAGSESVTATNFPVNGSVPATFYRLIYTNAP
jgi:hypothetical protein